MEKDGCFEMFRVTESIGHLFDSLDFAVQTFTDSVGNWVGKIGQDIMKMSFNQVSNLFHGLQTTVSSPPKPSSPILGSLLSARALPKTPKVLLDGPGPPYLEIQALETLKFFLTPQGDIFLPIKPKILGSLEGLIPFSLQELMLFLTNRIYRFSHVAQDMKSVEIGRAHV